MLLTRKIAFFLLISITTFAQSDLKKANKQFELKSFSLAIDSYKSVLVEDPSNANALLNLALSYGYSNDYIQAIRHFDKYMEHNGEIEAEYILDYAGLLKKVGLYDKAQIWYWKYKMINPKVGEHYALSCDYAKTILQEKDRYEISLCNASSRGSDFGVSFFEDRLVTSGFGDSKLSTVEKNSVFIENAETGNLEELNTGLKSKMGIGPVSYSRDGKMVAYSNNSFVNGQQQVFKDDKNMSIYFAFTDDNGGFDKETAFEYNSSEYSNAFPNLGFNGSALYFASNRAGGMGGFDLYVSYFKKGEWSEPQNLGPSVNTVGNEITPFFDGKNLYFSSDYTHGLGGYDIFKSKVIDGEWMYPENMGKGVNSPGDDYYFAINQNSGGMFYTSNRLGGRGKDDIYIAREVIIYDLANLDAEEEIDNVFVPKAVSLNDLNPMKRSSIAELDSDRLMDNYEKKRRRNNNNNNAQAVTVSENVTTVKEISTNKSSTSAKTVMDVDLFGARRVGVGEVTNTTADVYFIQLAALSKSRGDISYFKKLIEYGNLYKVYKQSATKVMLGYYLDRYEANEVLKSVRNQGYHDAFITFGAMNDSDLELVASSYESNDYKESSFDYSNQSNYKVRLAAYDDPLWFSAETVADLGKIEQWTKGDWTIFVLSGFSDFDKAQAASIKAINRGYQDAEVVVDNNGILEKMSSN